MLRDGLTKKGPGDLRSPGPKVRRGGYTEVRG